MFLKRLTTTLIAVGLLLAAPAVQAESEDTDAGVAAAEAWLALIDDGEYGESWQAAAEFFRNAVTQEQWESSLDAVRKPLGALESRSVKSAELRTELPGAPDGEYVLMQFDTSFANKAEAIETVTVMRESDGAWKAAGYFIK